METNAKKMVGKQVVRCLAKGGVEQVVAEVFSAGTKFTFDNLGKSVGFSLTSSGGHEVPKTVSDNLFRHFGEPALEYIHVGGVRQNSQSFSCEAQ